MQLIPLGAVIAGGQTYCVQELPVPLHHRRVQAHCALGKLGSENHAEGNTFPVRPGELLRSLNGMPKGVPIIQLLTTNLITDGR